MGTSKGGATSAPSTNDIRATSAPSTDDIHLSISFCLKRSIRGITSYVTWSKLLFSLFRVKSNNKRERRNWWLWNGVLILWRGYLATENCDIDEETMKFTSFIQMIQGAAISLSCDLKKSSLKNFVLPAKQPLTRRCDCQWFHWKAETHSARHTQKIHPLQTAID